MQGLPLKYQQVSCILQVALQYNILPSQPKDCHNMPLYLFLPKRMQSLNALSKIDTYLCIVQID